MGTRLARFVSSLLIIGMVCLAAPTVFAAQSILDDIRRQSEITSSYDFSPLPSNAGEGITVATVCQGVTRHIKDIVGDRLSVVSVLKEDPSPYDSEDSVGSGVVSLIAALAPNVKIINIKVLDDLGSGSYESITDGIVRATELGAKIIVLPVSANKGDDGVTRAVNAALRKGIVIMASAGNDSGGPIGYPSNLDGVLAIGATNQEQRVAGFSSVDPKSLYAPGVDVKSAANKGEAKPHSGTSYSVAVAGGIFAVLWSQDPSLTRDQLVDLVTKSAKQLKDETVKGKLIDAAAALRALTAAKPPPTPTN